MPGRRASRRNFRSNRSLRKRKKTRYLSKKSRPKSLRKQRMRRGGANKRFARPSELFAALRADARFSLIYQVFGYGEKSLIEERRGWKHEDFKSYCENEIYSSNINVCIEIEKGRATSNEVPDSHHQESIWNKIKKIPDLAQDDELHDWMENQKEEFARGRTDPSIIELFMDVFVYSNPSDMDLAHKSGDPFSKIRVDILNFFKYYKSRINYFNSVELEDFRQFHLTPDRIQELHSIINRYIASAEKGKDY